MSLSQKATAAFLTLQEIDSTQAAFRMLMYALAVPAAESSAHESDESSEYLTASQLEDGFRGVWRELDDEDRGDLPLGATMEQVGGKCICK